MKGSIGLTVQLQRLAEDGETVTPSLPEPGVWTGMASANALAPLRWEARENPSWLAAMTTIAHAASGSRVYVSSYDRGTSFAKPVAIGRGPYTSRHENDGGA